MAPMNYPNSSPDRAATQPSRFTKETETQKLHVMLWQLQEEHRHFVAAARFREQQLEEKLRYAEIRAAGHATQALELAEKDHQIVMLTQQLSVLQSIVDEGWRKDEHIARLQLQVRELQLEIGSMHRTVDRHLDSYSPNSKFHYDSIRSATSPWTSTPRTTLLPPWPGRYHSFAYSTPPRQSEMLSASYAREYLDTGGQDEIFRMGVNKDAWARIVKEAEARLAQDEEIQKKAELEGQDEATNSQHHTVAKLTPDHHPSDDIASSSENMVTPKTDNQLHPEPDTDQDSMLQTEAETKLPEDNQIQKNEDLITEQVHEPVHIHAIKQPPGLKSDPEDEDHNDDERKESEATNVGKDRPRKHAIRKLSFSSA